MGEGRGIYSVAMFHAGANSALLRHLSCAGLSAARPADKAKALSLIHIWIEQKKTTEREARKILARIAAQTGADIILSF